MDSLIAAAGRFLAAGDPLGALRFVALRDDPPALATLDPRGLPPSLSAIAHLAAAEIALRSLRTATARDALARARAAAERAGVPALLAEVAEARTALDRPAARRVRAGDEAPLRLDEVEALVASGTLIVDACRRGVRLGDTWRALARRPVLFALARMLAESWPADIERDALIEGAFRTRRPDDTHRARLRVELGRLRALVALEGEGRARSIGRARGAVGKIHDELVTPRRVAAPLDWLHGAESRRTHSASTGARR